MKLKWKVCGMRESGNIAEVLQMAPDFMGFIFYERSPRYVGDDWPGPGKDFPKTTAKVGVFVNEKIEKVKALATRYGLDFLQLHGNEHPDYCMILRQEGYRVIKVLPPRHVGDRERIELYQPWVDFFLFDTPSEKYGGSGKAFDWSAMEGYHYRTPVIISGGISLENVEQLCQLNFPSLAAVDVNSCFEIKPGLKDITSLQTLKNKLQEL